MTADELERCGFGAVGSDVQISRRAVFYGGSRIRIGTGSRIDDFCVISAGPGGVEIGRYVHIAVMVSIQGTAPISIGDFAGLSARTAVYSSNDDYSGRFMTNPTVDEDFTGVTSAPVTIGRHALVGAGCVVLPGVTLGDGAAVGSLSLVTRDCEPLTISMGIPAKAIKRRRPDLLALEDEFWKRRS